jgi:hypothetical protein
MVMGFGFCDDIFVFDDSKMGFGFVFLNYDWWVSLEIDLSWNLRVFMIFGLDD